jgi:hypothetical protein
VGDVAVFCDVVCGLVLDQSNPSDREDYQRSEPEMVREKSVFERLLAEHEIN